MLDLFKEVWSTLKQNKLRTTLTGFAVAWGIFMLIVLLGAGNGVMNAFLTNADMLTNAMTIYGGWTEKPYKGYEEDRYIRLRKDDADLLRQPEFADVVDEVSVSCSVGDSLVYNDFHASIGLMGVMPMNKDIDAVELYAGRFINSLDGKEKRRAIVIPSSLVDQIHGEGYNYSKMVGEYMKIGSFEYRVAGVYKADEEMMSSSIYCPYETLASIYMTGEYVDQINFTFHGLLTRQANEDFQNKVRRAFNAVHEAAPDDTRAIYIYDRYTSGQEIDKAKNIMRTSLWILGILTLLSGIVGVSNIMLITVKERTHEFGIRKAIGAKPASILNLILVESIAITAFFGYIGMSLGVLATYIMDKKLADQPMDLGVGQITMFVNPTVGMDVAIEATLVLIIAGTIAGLMPAWKAAHVKPIEALSAK
jgi:putative ABC transport system permease protein